MQQVTINTYKFNELSEAAKQVAIDWYKEVSQDDNFWDSVYDDFIELTNHLGLELDKDGLGFSGFYSQGDGSHFTTELNNRVIMAFIEAVNADKWIEYAPNEEYLTGFRKIKLSARFKNLIVAGNIDISIYTKSANHYSYMVNNWEFTVNNNNAVPLIDAMTEQLIKDVLYNLELLNSWFYKKLEAAYDDTQTDEYIIECIEGNEYDFTEDGKRSVTL